MILVETSVIIDYLKGNETPKSLLFDKIITNDLDFCISALTYQEVLQGAKNEKEFEQLKSFFSTQIIISLPAEKSFFEQAAGIYFSLRRAGKTVRSTIDVIIAMQAIDGKHILLHDDRDFDAIAEMLPDLKTLNELQ
ncbi:MAG: PIN domain-containing protein [Oscillospiraceae bacterium]|nr:PIN domain-containing protein [Oscillospiraceae bacterium]